MLSAQLATLGLRNIKVFWNKGYNVITSVCDVTNKILSREPYYIVDVVMWRKFRNFSISMGEVIIQSILQGFNQKNQFFLRGAVGWSSMIWDWHILQQCGKSVKTKSQKDFGANS